MSGSGAGCEYIQAIPTKTMTTKNSTINRFDFIARSSSSALANAGILHLLE
jgi:hypothetical protein